MKQQIKLEQNAQHWIDLSLALRRKGWKNVTPQTVANLAPDLRKDGAIGGGRKPIEGGGYVYTPGYPQEDDG